MIVYIYTQALRLVSDITECTDLKPVSFNVGTKESLEARVEFDKELDEEQRGSLDLYMSDAGYKFDREEKV